MHQGWMHEGIWQKRESHDAMTRAFNHVVERLGMPERKLDL